MSVTAADMAARVDARLAGKLVRREWPPGGLLYDVNAGELFEAARTLRDDPELRFEILVDIAGMDYLLYGRDEWRTTSATNAGFSRAVNRSPGAGTHDGPRFAAVYQLLSITHNQRLTLRAFCPDNEEPALDSLTSVWASANWFEREAFDLFGIVFIGHPDLRRILTDYGFIGHPFRKDFPLIGNVEVRYDEAKQRVVYEPVEITPRTLVPRVLRDDHRYAPELLKDEG